MKKFKYYARILILGFGLIPAVTSFVTLILCSGLKGLIIPASILVMILCAFLASKLTIKEDYPSGFIARYLPIVLPLLLTLIPWAVCMIISNGFYGANAFAFYYWFVLPFFPALLFANMLGYLNLVFLIPFTYNFFFFLFFVMKERKDQKRPKVSLWATITFLLIFITCMIIGGVTTFNRSKTVLPPDYGYKYGNGYSSVDLWNYDIANTDNILPKLKKDSTFKINEFDKLPDRKSTRLNASPIQKSRMPSSA